MVIRRWQINITLKDRTNFTLQHVKCSIKKVPLTIPFSKVCLFNLEPRGTLIWELVLDCSYSNRETFQNLSKKKKWYLVIWSRFWNEGQSETFSVPPSYENNFSISLMIINTQKFFKSLMVNFIFITFCSGSSCKNIPSKLKWGRKNCFWLTPDLHLSCTEKTEQ